MDQLTTHLLDLLFQLAVTDTPVMVGGGYGLFLKRRHLAATGERTLLQNLPEPRATNDLDIFLRAELLSDLNRTRNVRDVLIGLDYAPVEAAPFLQWKREVVIAGVTQEVKIDVLVGPLGEFREKLKVSMPRVRPRGRIDSSGRAIDFHAHATEEAILIEDQPIPVDVSGFRSTGEAYAARVDVPEAFPYLMMKLHAFADRSEDGNSDLGRHHALDVYAIVGMMTESEYERAKQAGVQQSHNPHVERAQSIVKNCFSRETDIGLLRIREHSLYRPDFQLDDFTQVIHEIFPAGPS